MRVRMISPSYSGVRTDANSLPLVALETNVAGVASDGETIPSSWNMETLALTGLSERLVTVSLPSEAVTRSEPDEGLAGARSSEYSSSESILTPEEERSVVKGLIMDRVLAFSKKS